MKTDMKTNGFTDEQQNKKKFVDFINAALIRTGEGRYDYLAETPLTYEVKGSEEYVLCGNARAYVTGDSLTAIMADISNQIF